MLQPLKDLIVKYTPALLDAVVASPPEQIQSLRVRLGGLPENYVEFLEWMGGACPILAAEELEYSPRELLEYQAEDTAPVGYLLIAIDNSDASLDVHIRLEDGVIVCFTEDFEPVTAKRLLLENLSLSSFLLTAYTRNNLVPSYPLHFSAAFKGDSSQLEELHRRISEGCAQFSITTQIKLPDFRFYGGEDFALATHQRPGSSIVIVHFGTIERAQYEAWHDLVFARWHFLRMPES